MKKILSDKKFKKIYPELFSEEKLKTAPRGFSTDHPDIELLKVKHYVVLHTLSDKDVAGKSFESKAIEAFKTLLPFNKFLKVAIT